ncbi:MAG: homoaconitate hydratase family protein [Proteobacteria bacterium]|nr:homoaconitate hydratase family protein [Pseudomonadota bacterium]
MTIIEKIIANHGLKEIVKPGEIVNMTIDVRIARDFGGPNVVKNIEDYDLGIDDPSKTFFTFDTNPGGSLQKYAANQQKCRIFARKHGIKIYDINAGIGTHLAIDRGLAVPGSTLVSTDSHANILGAIGAFGQGMGDKDIASAFASGSVWFKVPKSVKLVIKGKRPENIYAKDIVLNLLNRFGANELLGYSIELYGEEVEKMTLDERITVSSMATEMGAIAILFPPNNDVIEYCKKRTGKEVVSVYADEDAHYEKVIELDISKFVPMVSRPGHPDDVVAINEVKKIKIDSAFIGSCTNGRLEDMRTVAKILKGRKVAPGVVLKIVPSTDEVWQKCLDEGIIKIFKNAGALVGNAGCAGCAEGQIGQNGPGEVTISTGNRNFPGKQGKGQVYLGSPAEVAASAVAGYITTENEIPEKPATFEFVIEKNEHKRKSKSHTVENRPTKLQGKVWIINIDNIDTDMIYHNKFLVITNINEMGKYALGNLKGWEDFAKKAEKDDIIIAGKNFGAGSSRQQAVDCFKALGVQLILAKSFGAIYERNAINVALPVLTYANIDSLELKNRDSIEVDLKEGILTNLENGKSVKISKFSDIQMQIYQKGGLLN